MLTIEESATSAADRWWFIIAAPEEVEDI